VRDPQNPDARPMLGRANVHWAFNFNSEASLLEGNRIQDNGGAASPRFITTKTVEGYSPLDQYLMGFRAAAEVAPTFLVNETTVSAARAPQPGVSFNGQRRDITVDDLIAVYGRRIPDYTVSQRHFRFGFIILTAAGAAPPADAIAQVDAYRTQFESFYAGATSNRATADTVLKRAVHVSAFPALAVPQGGAGTATITLDQPAITPLTVFLSGQSGIAGVPASVTITAGAAKTVFPVEGLRAGTEELTLRPADASYETVYTRVAVAPDTGSFSLALASGDSIFRVSDSNRLPVTGVRVTATITGKGSLASPSIITDENGVAAFNWTPGASGNQITAMIEGVPTSAITVKLARPVVFGVTNAASYVPGITPGAYASVFGADLATTVQVLVNGELAKTTYISDGQINLLIPADIVGTPATITVITPAASSIESRVASYPVSPGIFAVVNRGTALEIYATGLNGASPQVSIGGMQATVVYIGQPQFPGLDQVNVLVPGGLSAGQQRVVITAGGVTSNSADVQLP
jgi:hypothetical protein